MKSFKCPLCTFATFSLLWLLSAFAGAQDPGDLLMLPALELGEVVDVDGFVGKQNRIDVRTEFENGSFDGIWGVDGQAVNLRIISDFGTFHTVWNRGGGAMVSFKGTGTSDIPDLDWFGGVWTSNTSPPSPADVLDLFLEDDVPVVGGAPLLLGFVESGLQIGVDLEHVHKLTGRLGEATGP